MTASSRLMVLFILHSSKNKKYPSSITRETQHLLRLKRVWKGARPPLSD
jgi:hypothetical protein